MTSSQQFADQALAQWQELRALPPEVRIERLMAEFFLPPISLDVKYEDTLRHVAQEMALSPAEYDHFRLAGAFAGASHD